GGQAREVFGFLRGGGPAYQSIVTDGVLDVDDHPGRRIHGRKFLYSQYRLEETAALASILLGNLDPHQPHFEELADDVFAKRAGLVHLAHVWTDLLASELANGGLEEPFLFAQGGKRLGSRFRPLFC